jgi:hypothetical protein
MTLREILNEGTKAPFISAGTGKKVVTFVNYDLFYKSGDAQVVQTEDGNFDVYASNKHTAAELSENKKYYIGTLENKWGKDYSAATLEAYKMIYNADGTSEEMKKTIRDHVKSYYSKEI